MDTLINSYAVSIIYLQYQQIILLHAYTYASVCTNYKLPQATLNGFSLGVLSILDPIMPHKRDTLYYFFGTQSILKTFSKLEKDVDTMKLFRVQEFSYVRTVLVNVFAAKFLSNFSIATDSTCGTSITI